MAKVIIIGGGAGGLMAAVRAAELGGEVTILEKNKRLGKKLLITGKGRCNVTNSAEINEFITNIPGNGRFLYSVFNRYFNWDVRSFFEENGVALKEERGGRIFPVSDKALDIVNCFEKVLRKYAVAIKYEEDVQEILVQDGVVKGVKTAAGKEYEADAVILATGGAAFPGTGSNGDGAKMAKAIGHTIVELEPALVPLETEEEWVPELQGLSLRNVRVSKMVNNKMVKNDFGEMLFTHYGVTGPLILTLSRGVKQDLKAKKLITFAIDLKPALTEEQLDKRIQRDFTKYSRKQIKNALGDLLPAKLIPVIIDLAYLDENKFVNQISKKERERLVHLLKHLEFTIKNTRPLSEAIVTSGGISTKEINPKTMESKVVKNLYCVGEVTDIDGFTGGYNLQVAFSMGYVAGENAMGSNHI